MLNLVPLRVLDDGFIHVFLILIKSDLFRNALDPFSALVNGLMLLNKMRQHWKWIPDP